MMEAYEGERDIAWINITRQDNRIPRSNWAERFPSLRDVFNRDGATTPGSLLIASALLGY